MKKHIIFVVLIMFCAFLARGAPDNIQKESKEIGEMAAPKDHDFSKYNVDTGYKMFYGEWEATRKVGESYRFDVQDVSDIIGAKLVFTGWNCHYYYDGKEINIDYPTYKITIIPLDEKTTYFPYMPTFNEMGITGDYVTLFTIKDGEEVYVLVKDDQTLLMFYKDAYIELKRTKYIPHHDAFYIAL